MTANIIDAIINLVENPITNLIEYNQGKNRANNTGAALEEYIKNLFAGSFNLDENQRLKKINDTFSYLGNNSNPPDAMLCDGDAIEIKKIENPNAKIALNSSYPKQKLYANSSMISSECKTAEEWYEKDIIYTIGVVKNSEIKHLCMVYGLDYCASENYYNKIKSQIKYGIKLSPTIGFVPSNELGRITRVDPLAITNLRIRGMWEIQNPWNVFSDIYSRNSQCNFSFMCIINDEKWEEFCNTDLLFELTSINKRLKIEDVKIKNPDNPIWQRDARLITFEI